MLKQKYFLTDFFILSAEKQPIKLSWRNIEWLPLRRIPIYFADGNYAAEEKALVQQLADAFEFDRAFIEQAINLEDAYVAAYMSLVNLVEKGE